MQQLESRCPPTPQEDVFFLRIVWNSDLWIPPWALVLLKIVLDTFLRCYFIDNTEHLEKDLVEPLKTTLHRAIGF